MRFVDREHPVSKGLGESFVATDELYHQMTVLPSARVLATAFSDPATGGTGKDEPILWTNTFGQGRAYFTALGHEVAAMQNAGFKAAFLRGAEWAATGRVTLPADAGTVKPRPDALRVLVVTGGHDYPTSFYTVFEGRPEWRFTHAASNEEAFAKEIVSRYDVLVLYDFSQKLGEEGKGHLRAFAEAGKGIVVLHHALCDYQDWPWFEEMAGGRYLDGRPGGVEGLDLPARRRALREAGGEAPDRGPDRADAARGRDVQGDADLAEGDAAPRDRPPGRRPVRRPG